MSRFYVGSIQVSHLCVGLFAPKSSLMSTVFRLLECLIICVFRVHTSTNLSPSYM
jgi:hypothetical protein